MKESARTRTRPIPGGRKSVRTQDAFRLAGELRAQNTELRGELKLAAEMLLLFARDLKDKAEAT